MNSFSIIGIEDLPEFTKDDDLAARIVAHCDLQDGDILVITSKVVSKVEGRILPAPDRKAAIASETVRVVAARGETIIGQTRHGFVMAAAGVDASNLPMNQIALLPEDPDASARKLRAELSAATGAKIAVLITDTFGRPWRNGLVDQAIGCAGLSVMDDSRGKQDAFGNELQASVAAVADEISAASELVRRKLSQVPAAIVRGLAHFVTTEDGPGVSPLLRPPETDMFKLGHRETITSRRTIRDFSDRPVDDSIIREAIGAAITAPAPHHSTPWRFAVIKSPDRRTALLDAMTEAWREDLRMDGFPAENIEARVHRGAFLYSAPVLVIPCLITAARHEYPDNSRADAEHAMFTLSSGAAIENFLLLLNSEGVGSAWVSAALFCPSTVTDVLGLDPSWQPLGTIAVGYGSASPKPRPKREIDEFYVQY
ncbi:MAG TPA: coenzyme F420-0:L-glutamate ligase [Candidatus Nanopelagicaceae bacterium]|nr:coenzyme F420-0:L-glutamate ligase [Candidatus Nanopelagicaceae bacterium]